MVGIKPPSPIKIWRFSSAHFQRKGISEINNLWYNILEVINGISGSQRKSRTNHTQVSQTCISKTNLIFFYGRCRVMHYADFLPVRQGTVASFQNPDLTNKSWDVHLYCTLMAYRMRCDFKKDVARKFYRKARIGGEII